MKHRGLPLNGWLNLDKPVGMTSTQALGRARRILGAGKAGHGGTLDPLASGVLPIAFGEATKTVAYVMDAEKVYRFGMGWGELRSTDDAEGEVTATSGKRPDKEEIEAVLPLFCGRILQKPPAFSALKVAGQRAYDLARSGEEVNLAPREVFIKEIKLIAGLDTFEVTCGKGVYIRSLARDLALALGTVGHVASLCRLRVGQFTLENAVTLETPDIQDRLLPIETAFEGLPSMVLDDAEAQRLRLGQRIALVGATRQEHQPLVVFTAGGLALGFAELGQGELRPVRLFNR